MDISSYGIIWIIMKITSYHNIRMKPFYSVRSNINTKITLLQECFWRFVFLKQILHSLSSLRLRLQTWLRSLMPCLTAALLAVPLRDGPDRLQPEMGALIALILLKNETTLPFFQQLQSCPVTPPAKSPPIEISYQFVIHKVGKTHGRIPFARTTGKAEDLFTLRLNLLHVFLFLF